MVNGNRGLNLWGESNGEGITKEGKLASKKIKRISLFSGRK